ncbi:uncharacterized protein LOC123315973 [Coccinella septempunctata]|uniref:uncharacterized protein LOC123315973 n=1 Tax=Coccinella septempunctata TaxID=41139 RepID=UPI001D05F2B3|nr:uncharacterized protein LOC123315973 [Coccinella septempunctata]
MGRMYGRLLKGRLEENIKTKIGEDQAGFTAGRSCQDHIYTIQQLVEKRAVHIAFEDLQKAYDSVPRIKIWEALEKLDIPQNQISATKKLYSENVVSVKLMRKRLGNSFKTTKGLLQGCSHPIQDIPRSGTKTLETEM